jgi:hypothetical protein
MPHMIFSEYILNMLCEEFRSAVRLNHAGVASANIFSNASATVIAFLSFKGTANARLEKTSMLVKMKRYPSFISEKDAACLQDQLGIDPEYL